MFSCDHCKYRIESKQIMDIHNRTFHNRVAKYNCDIFGHQVLQKLSLVRHKKIAHKVIKHKRAVHKGVKYPCGQCRQQFTQIPA